MIGGVNCQHCSEMACPLWRDALFTGAVLIFCIVNWCFKYIINTFLCLIICYYCCMYVTLVLQLSRIVCESLYNPWKVMSITKAFGHTECGVSQKAVWVFVSKYFCYGHCLESVLVVNISCILQNIFYKVFAIRPLKVKIVDGNILACRMWFQMAVSQFSVTSYHILILFLYASYFWVNLFCEYVCHVWSRFERSRR